MVTHLLPCMTLENTTNAVARHPQQKACVAFLIIQNYSFSCCLLRTTLADKYP